MNEIQTKRQAAGRQSDRRTDADRADIHTYTVSLRDTEFPRFQRQAERQTNRQKTGKVSMLDRKPDPHASMAAVC